MDQDDERAPLTRSPAVLSLQDDSKTDSKKLDKVDEFPSEFECCFCTTKNHREPSDAEGLMPLPTSDLKNPICLELKNLQAENDLLFMDDNQEHLLDNPLLPDSNANIINNTSNNNNNGYDVGSIDSSGTYASCQTQPFFSQGDLTDDLCSGDSNLYVNPLQANENTVLGVRKSASGDTALGAVVGAGDALDPLEEQVRATMRGSRASLADCPPYQRNAGNASKARFQQGNKAGSGSSGSRGKTRFDIAGKQASLDGSQESLDAGAGGGSKSQRGNGGGGAGVAAGAAGAAGGSSRKPSFLPHKGSLASSATKIINHHLFNLQSKNKNGSSKSSGAASDSSDSLESRASRTSGHPEPHRRNKSILKKGDSSSGRSADPETEKLISDSGSLDSENSSPARRPRLAEAVAKDKNSGRPGTAPSRLDSRSDSRTESRSDSQADSRADSRTENRTESPSPREQDGPAVIGRAAMSARQLKAMFLESGPGALPGAPGALPGALPGVVDVGGIRSRGNTSSSLGGGDAAGDSDNEETRLLLRRQAPHTHCHQHQA